MFARVVVGFLHELYAPRPRRFGEGAWERVDLWLYRTIHPLPLPFFSFPRQGQWGATRLQNRTTRPKPNTPVTSRQVAP